MFLDFGGALLAVLGLLLAKIPSARDADAANQRVLANLRDGWRAVSARRGLKILIVGLVAGSMIMAPWGTVFPLMTYDHFGGGGFEAALVEALWGGGMLVGSVALMVWGGGKRLVPVIVLSLVGAGALTCVCGLLPHEGFAAFAVLTGISAIVCAWFNGPFMTILQRSVAPEKLGRVMGFTTAATGLAAPLGVALGGVLAEAIGVAAFFMVAGAGLAALGALMYLPKSVRALDESTDETTESDGGSDGIRANA